MDPINNPAGFPNANAGLYYEVLRRLVLQDHGSQLGPIDRDRAKALIDAPGLRHSLSWFTDVMEGRLRSRDAEHGPFGYLKIDAGTLAEDAVGHLAAATAHMGAAAAAQEIEAHFSPDGHDVELLRKLRGVEASSLRAAIAKLADGANLAAMAAHVLANVIDRSSHRADLGPEAIAIVPTAAATGQEIDPAAVPVGPEMDALIAIHVWGRTERGEGIYHPRGAGRHPGTEVYYSDPFYSTDDREAIEMLRGYAAKGFMYTIEHDPTCEVNYRVRLSQRPGLINTFDGMGLSMAEATCRAALAFELDLEERDE